ncbi:AAA family ATPase [Mesorhizobium sp. BR1-1-6]|uniref:AAA family ATPase n=1 Tax=Mesorhizobium sp. BR1-1-6 TaxID=2876648 RepID=UPI001CD0EDAF|nr:AAA family ATPase [Mesorhizobium sp. BR1-1-6]MBZ9898531.1 AAA family ATPase [Mesorhizobium sp. BR1-1-6]
MLLKINRIKDLGVFSDYIWDAKLPTFERFNVVYGENGSGKTTLSRLFDCLMTGLHEEYPSLEFKIESETGELAHGMAAARKVRVFNADFVQSNIGQLDGNLKPILVIGEENKAVAEALAADEVEVAKRNSAITAAEARIKSHETGRGKIFSQIASTISEATSGTTQRTYRKNNAESAFANLSATSTLSDEQLATHRTTVRQEVMGRIDASPHVTFRIGETELALRDCADYIRTNAEALCGRAAISDAISRLKDNPDIARWVEEGHSLHKKRGEPNCEFCGQLVPGERWKELEAHFNKEDQTLKADIEGALADIERLRSMLSEASLPDRLALYSDFRDQYDAATGGYADALEAAHDALNTVAAELAAKLDSRTVSIPFDYALSFDNLGNSITAIAAALDAHNTKTSGFDTAKAEARDAIEGHYLFSVKGDVAAFDQKITDDNALIKENTDGNQAAGRPALATLQASIAEKKAQISNTHKAGEQLTQMLQTFLGRSELVFNSGDDGYRVHRNGKNAKRLSEGERTAIAFIYFIVQLKDQDFKLSDGVVVIDDPVSSLDSNSVYQAFAFLKNAVRGAKQVFLLTHNFSFLRLLINWLQNDPATRKKNQLYMLVCQIDAAGRHSTIVGLDRTLIDHPTEYHFLFKTLATFKGDGTIAGCYHIPNVTRKVLETFLDFFVPGNNSLYAKLSAVKFDENKKTAIYKYANDLSHFTGQGFEPGLVQESQKNVTYLLEMIQALAPQHYDGMVTATS